MKAITVHQPYAHLIATGEKRVENRNWPTRYRGPLAIHAGKSRERLALDSSGIDDSGIPVAEMAFSAVVAVVQLVDCIHITDIRGQKKWEKKYPGIRAHLHTEGPYCWILKNPVRLAVPFHATGAQGMWILDGYRLRHHLELHQEKQLAITKGKRDQKRLEQMFTG